MLSQKAHYALRAVLHLASKGGGRPMQTVQIAKAASLPAKYLEGILLELRKYGILISYRGCKGGFVLARPASEISFADVVAATDGSLALSGCVSEVAYARCDDCFDESHCEIRRALEKAREATSAVLRSYDVASAAQRMQCAGSL